MLLRGGSHQLVSNAPAAGKYGIHIVPTLMIGKNGVIFKKHVGVIRPDVLEKDLYEALK